MNRIKELIEEKKSKGEKININLLSKKLYPGSSLTSARQCFHNLKSNKTKKLTLDQIRILLEEFNCKIEELYEN